jgi:hypothetical protein
MSIAQQIVVRYRAAGHVRFSIPSPLCQPQVQQALVEGLMFADGIYRVDVFPRQGKLSIRYIEGVADFKSVARDLSAVIGGLDLNADLSAEAHECCGSQSLAPQVDRPGFRGWLKEKFQAAKETVTALGIVANPARREKPLLTPEKEKFVVDFLTDILVLYLIRLHWHLIITAWVKRPWLYRGEWAATLYMIFLLVRSKRPKN